MSELLLALALICQSKASWTETAAVQVQKACTKNILKCLATKKTAYGVVTSYNISQVVECL